MLRHLELFLFPSRTSNWLTVLRLGLGLQVIFYAVSISSDWQELFLSGERHGVNREVAEAILNVTSPLVPRLGWLTRLAGIVGVSEEIALQIAWAVLFIAGVLLLVGLFSRCAAIAAWLLHLSTASSGGLTAYGVDIFTTIGLFYIAVAPLPDAYSANAILGKRRLPGSELLGFHQRVLQVHLCFIYFFGGLAKCLGCGWWDGSSLWRSLTRPPFDLVPIELLARWSALLFPAGICVLILETFYPVFIWPMRTRKLWLGSIVVMHLAIAMTMGLRLFAFVMIVLNLAAFGDALLFPGLVDGARRLISLFRRQVERSGVSS